MAAFVVAADVISKAVVVARMATHPPIRLFGGALTITLTRNPGAAFSIGTSMTIVFTAIAVGVIVYILRTARNLRSVGWAITLGLLLGGATGNLLDRIFRAPGAFQGRVVDWIQLPDWPVFNLADSSIVCAGVLVVLLALRGIRLDGTRPVPEASSREPDTPDPDISDPDIPDSYIPDSYIPDPDIPDPDIPDPDIPDPDIPDPDIPAPDISDSDIPAPDIPAPDIPKSEYPERQSAVPGQADAPDRMADGNR